MVRIAHTKTPIGPESKLKILRAARHYILVLRAEGSNWFYICKRAVKLSWLSFQYFSTAGPPLRRFNPTTVSNLQFPFLCVHFKLLSVHHIMLAGHASVPPLLTTLVCYWSPGHWTQAYTDQLAANIPGLKYLL